MTGATRGQVKRALEWANWLALKPKGRGKKAGFPRCVSCGSEADGTHVSDQPRYNCHHPPLRIDDETMDRGRRELPG